MQVRRVWSDELRRKTDNEDDYRSSHRTFTPPARSGSICKLDKSESSACCSSSALNELPKIAITRDDRNASRTSSPVGAAAREPHRRRLVGGQVVHAFGRRC